MSSGPNSYHSQMTFNRTFFVTTITWQRTPLFRNQRTAELMMDILAHYREQQKFILHEFVIMSDHLHLLLTPALEISLERAMQFIKGGFSYRWGKSGLSSKRKGLVWQESFTNHRIHDEQDFAHHGEYIRTNPVRARLVERPELYPYSSAYLKFNAAKKVVLDTAI
jgi:putative transposase